MQNKGYDVISRQLTLEIRKYFKDKVGTFALMNCTDTPYTEFRMEFQMYKYVNVVLIYDRGSIGCSIPSGTVMIPLDNSQQWYDKFDMQQFLRELEIQLELRIPDKFLEYYGWK